MDSYIQTVQVNDTKAVVFIHSTFDGMVGETIYHSQAKELDIEKDKLKQLSYPELKDIYKTIEGKSQRIKFWSNMKELSPKMVNLNNELSTEEAIFRVI